MRMPNRAPVSVTASSTAPHFRVVSKSPGTMPSSIARPKIHGPTIGGSCQIIPSAVVVRITGHWIFSIQSRNRIRVRVSGAAVGSPPPRA